jgi:hypothetical protein
MKAAMVLSILLVAGCAQQPQVLISATQPADEWKEPARYSYVLDSRCGERPLIGRFQVEVANGRVTRAIGLDESGRSAVARPSGDPVPTIGGLLAVWERARKGGAHVATVERDPADGHPVRITIDRIKNAIDDEACFTISNYRAS